MPAREKTADSLQRRLDELKQQEKIQTAELRESFGTLVESISPSSILKNSVQEIVSSPGLRSNLLNTAVGIGAGMIGKKLFVGKSGNIFKKIGGTAVEFFLSNFVRNKIAKQQNHQPAG